MMIANSICKLLSQTCDCCDHGLFVCTFQCETYVVFVYMLLPGRCLQYHVWIPLRQVSCNFLAGVVESGDVRHSKHASVRSLKRPWRSRNWSGKWWLQMLNFSMIFEICHKMLAKNDILHVHHSASICCWSIPAIVNCQLGMDPCCGCLSFNLRQQRTHESFGLGWLTSGSMFLRDSHCFIKLCIS